MLLAPCAWELAHPHSLGGHFSVCWARDCTFSRPVTPVCTGFLRFPRCSQTGARPAAWPRRSVRKDRSHSKQICSAAAPASTKTNLQRSRCKKDSVLRGRRVAGNVLKRHHSRGGFYAARASYRSCCHTLCTVMRLERLRIGSCSVGIGHGFGCVLCKLESV